MKYSNNMTDMDYFQYKLFKGLKIKPNDPWVINCEIEWQEVENIE